MIPINQITESALQTRFENLPEKLQGALESPSYMQIVEQICRSHHIIQEERALMVQQLTALVLFGFVHSYDLPHELNEQLNLNNPKLAESIAQGLEAKVFAPFKNELAVNYEPPSETETKTDLPILDEVAPSVIPPENPLPVEGALPAAPAETEHIVRAEIGNETPVAIPLEKPQMNEAPPVAFEGLKATAAFEAHREIPSLGPENQEASEGGRPVFIHRETAPRVIELENDFSTKLRAAEFSPAGEEARETMTPGDVRPARLSFGENDAAVEALFKEPVSETPRIVDYAAPLVTETVPHDLPIAPFDGEERISSLFSQNGGAKTARPPKTKTAPIDPTERALPQSPELLELPGSALAEPTKKATATPDIQKKTLTEIFFPPAAAPISGEPAPAEPSDVHEGKPSFFSRLFGRRKSNAKNDVPVSLPPRETETEEGDLGAILESLAAPTTAQLENTAPSETAPVPDSAAPIRAAPRVVHYNAFTTPVAEAVTPKAPKPPAPPPAPPASPFTF